MVNFFRFRSCVHAISILAVSAVSLSAFAQDKPTHGTVDEDDPITYYGGVNVPDPVPEPFTMALGAGAVGLYARRRYVKSRAAA